jgi:hypothetical protein
MAARSSSAMFSIFVRFRNRQGLRHGGDQLVFDSMTVSRIRSRFARSVGSIPWLHDGVGGTGGFTSVAPHEDSALTGTPRPSK